MKFITSPEAVFKLASIGECYRQGYYFCEHCNRVSHIGDYRDESRPPCPHCKRKREMTWHPPGTDERRK